MSEPKKERVITEWMLEHCQNCSILQTQEKMDQGEMPIQKIDENAGYRTISSERCSLCGEFIDATEEIYELTMNRVVKVKDPVTLQEETHANDVETLAILCSEACKDRLSEIIMSNLQFPEVAVAEEDEEEEKEDWQS